MPDAPPDREFGGASGIARGWDVSHNCQSSVVGSATVTVVLPR
jgi:hypothetical protein